MALPTMPTTVESPVRSFSPEKKRDSTLFSRVAASDARVAAEMAPRRSSFTPALKLFSSSSGVDASPETTSATHP